MRQIFGVMIALLVSVATTGDVFAKQKTTDEPIAPKAVPIPSVSAAPLLPIGATTTEGTPVAVDGDTLQIGDKAIRLYGIAAPDIRANRGPDARLALDQLIAQQRVSCGEFDRQKDNLIIAICKIGSDDLGEKMLQSGFAAVYRSQVRLTADELALARRYDAAEAQAREQHIGIWTLPPKSGPAIEVPKIEPPKVELPEAEALKVEAPKAEPSKPAPEFWIDRQMIKNWMTAAPILLISLIALALFSRSIGKQWQEDRWEAQLSGISLLAQILAEVLAIREAAAKQIGGLSNLPPDRPIPTTQLAIMGLPPALIYPANAGQLYRLQRDTGVDLVQFYAAHAAIGQMLRQAAHLRADGLRHAYAKIVEAADLVLERGRQQLD